MGITITGWIGLLIGLAAGGFFGIIVGVTMADEHWRQKTMEAWTAANKAKEAPDEIEKD